MGLYREDSGSVAADARAWAIEHGNDPLYRICLAGYDGEHPMPEDLEKVAWTANGGYGNQGDNQNRHREVLWFSPHCLKPSRQASIFDSLPVVGAEVQR